ncbi:phage tail protein, partial [uncultured Desulfovibrio sp.]|uniref:phage tail protein n=1 Tax=uncultured Desulfovibrio sp. TaxID=167968 RepID=UPI002629C7DD
PDGTSITVGPDGTISAVGSSGGVPVGASLSWGGMHEPEGWLFANGGLARKADYPALYAAIGDAYGGADVPSDSFRLPNLREYADVSPMERVDSGNCSVVAVNTATGDVVFVNTGRVRLWRNGAAGPEDLPPCPVSPAALAFDSSNGHVWCAGTLRTSQSLSALAVLRNENWEIAASDTGGIYPGALDITPLSHDVWFAAMSPQVKVRVLRGGTGEPLSVWDSGIPGTVTSIRCDPSGGDVWMFAECGGVFVLRGGAGEVVNAMSVPDGRNGKLAVNPVTGDVHLACSRNNGKCMSATLPGGGGARVDCEMPGVQGIASLSPDSVSGWLWAVYQYNGPTGNSMFGVALRRDIRAGWEYFPYGPHLSWCAVNPATHNVWACGSGGLCLVRGNAMFFRILRAA